MSRGLGDVYKRQVHNPVKEFVPLKEVKVGQEVCIAELNQLATVLSLPDKNGDVLVRAGINADPVGRVAHHRPERLFPALISPGAEQRCFPKEKCCTEADDTHQKADDRRSGRAALSSPACVSWI